MPCSPLSTIAFRSGLSLLYYSPALPRLPAPLLHTFPDRHIVRLGIPMSTSNPTLPIMERAEVHRSAKTLEGLIAVFHDYCQTVTACANLQKKLARSMKDAAGVKTIHASAGELRL